MANVAQYRKGYEDMTREIAEGGPSLSEIPEAFVKGVIRLPISMAEDFLRSADEERGRHDALHGLKFDPFREEREHAEEEARERRERQIQLEAEQAAQNKSPKGGRPRYRDDDGEPNEGSDLTVTLVKLGLGLALVVLAILIVFYSMPFWLGGLFVGWLSGFCLGVVRAHRLGAAGLQAAGIREGEKRGKYVVDEAFLETHRKGGFGPILPLAACGLWCVLLALPVFQITDAVPWAGIAAMAASVAGLVFAGIWARKGFRRSLAWCVRCAHELPGGADAGWGSAGALSGLVLLLLLAGIGRSLPSSLLHDYGTTSSNSRTQTLRHP